MNSLLKPTLEILYRWVLKGVPQNIFPIFLLFSRKTKHISQKVAFILNRCFSVFISLQIKTQFCGFYFAK